MSKKVVFFFPSFASTEATAPLGILAVATPLLQRGLRGLPDRFHDYAEFQEAGAGRSAATRSASAFRWSRAR